MLSQVLWPASTTACCAKHAQDGSECVAALGTDCRCSLPIVLIAGRWPSGSDTLSALVEGAPALRRHCCVK